MDNIERKLENIETRIGSIDTTLTKQSMILDEHIRRTALLEGQLIPIKKHVDFIQGLFKLLGAAGIAVSMIHTILKMLGR